MKTKIGLMLGLFMMSIASMTNAQTASEIIEKSDQKLRGVSAYSVIKISTIRPKWSKES